MGGIFPGFIMQYVHAWLAAHCNWPLFFLAERQMRWLWREWAYEEVPEFVPWCLWWCWPNTNSPWRERHTEYQLRWILNSEEMTNQESVAFVENETKIPETYSSYQESDKCRSNYLQSCQRRSCHTSGNRRWYVIK